MDQKLSLKIVLLISLVVFACSPEPVVDKQNEESLTSQPNIIYLDDYYTNYLKTLSIDYSQRDKYYKEKVAKPLLEDYFLKSEYAELVKETFAYGPSDSIGLIRAIQRLKSNQPEINALVKTAYEKSSVYLKNERVTFYILPAYKNMKAILEQMGGVIGLTAGSKQVLLTIDPDVNSWKEVLEYSIAHELNHCYWTKNNFKKSQNWTMLDYLVFEGKADYFAHSLYPKVKVPWTSALSEKDKTELWQKIKPNLKSEDSSLMEEMMFGSEKYPVWGGYKLGFDIVQSAFVKHPELLKTDWTLIEEAEILEMSGSK